MQTINTVIGRMQAYGTSEGVSKAWDSRGRGKAVDTMNKASKSRVNNSEGSNLLNKTKQLMSKPASMQDRQALAKQLDDHGMSHKNKSERFNYDQPGKRGETAFGRFADHQDQAHRFFNLASHVRGEKNVNW